MKNTRKPPPTFETLSPGESSGGKPLADVLAFGAHPDDVEIAMGGTLLALKALGMTTVACHLTDGEPTPYGNSALRKKEAARAAERLRLDAFRILPLKNRELQDTLRARRLVAEVIREFRPRIVFAPYWVDAHPDHWNASALVEAGRFWAKLVKTDMKHDPWWPPKLYYHFCTHLKLNPPPAFIMDISGRLDGKIHALRSYESQFVKNPQSRAFEHVELRARYYGSLIGREAGEPFFSRETPGISDPRVLL